MGHWERKVLSEIRVLLETKDPPVVKVRLGLKGPLEFKVPSVPKALMVIKALLVSKAVKGQMEIRVPSERRVPRDSWDLLATVGF